LCRAPAFASGAEQLRRLQQHADKGNDADAQYELGGAYARLTESFMPLEKSRKLSLQYYELAGAQGHARAQDALGACFELGIKLDFKAAAQWYRRAADQGLPQAQFHLGAMFFDGTGVAQSHVEAVKWYRLAAAQGHVEALFHLGCCHRDGRGVPQDVDEAQRLMERAAALLSTAAAG
jgi:hypothetical protein